MKPNQKLLAGFVALSGFSASQGATGIDWIDANTNLTVYGDVRLRYEVDWDSQTAAGTMRDDRHRGRILSAGRRI